MGQFGSAKLIFLSYYRLFDKGNYLDYDELTKINAVAIQPQQKMTYSKIDFADFVPSNYSQDVIILNLKLNHSIYHTFQEIDKCCKLNGKNVEYDGIDNIERIDCKMPRKEFTEKFVNRREAVIMKGCQKDWKAKHWTIENLLNRYYSINNEQNAYLTWTTSFQKTIDGEIEEENLTSNDVKNAINSGYFVKVFHRLMKNFKGWVEEEYLIKYLKLDLLDEYSYPMPMPNDECYNYHVNSDQAYLMLATSDTGTYVF